jgi:hypothetical protein
MNAQVASAPNGWTGHYERRGHLFDNDCGFSWSLSGSLPGPPWPAAACRAPERAGRRLSEGDGPRAEDGILAPRRPQRLHLLGRRGHPSARKTAARRRADRRARERPSLELRIALTGGWPDTGERLGRVLGERACAVDPAERDQ